MSDHSRHDPQGEEKKSPNVCDKRRKKKEDSYAHPSWLVNPKNQREGKKEGISFRRARGGKGRGKGEKDGIKGDGGASRHEREGKVERAFAFDSREKSLRKKGPGPHPRCSAVRVAQRRNLSHGGGGDGPRSGCLGLPHQNAEGERRGSRGLFPCHQTACEEEKKGRCVSSLNRGEV